MKSINTYIKINGFIFWLVLSLFALNVFQKTLLIQYFMSIMVFVCFVVYLFLSSYKESNSINSPDNNKNSNNSKFSFSIVFSLFFIGSCFGTTFVNFKLSEKYYKKGDKVDGFIKFLYVDNKNGQIMIEDFKNLDDYLHDNKRYSFKLFNDSGIVPYALNEEVICKYKTISKTDNEIIYEVYWDDITYTFESKYKVTSNNEIIPVFSRYLSPSQMFSAFPLTVLILYIYSFLAKGLLAIIKYKRKQKKELL